MATSRKAIAKRAGKGTKLKFDDEGVAHPVYDLVSEAEFLAQGSPEEMKRQFVEETAKKMQTVDEGDRQEAKEKKRLKRMKKADIED
jgi:ATP-dependent RNA helicase DDX10/DBP4